MKLQSLRIEAEEKYLNGYSNPTTTVYTGTVKFRDTKGNIETVLTEEQMRGIVSAVGEALIDATKRCAVAMEQSVLEEIILPRLT